MSEDLTLSIVIPADQKQLVIDCFSINHGYRAKIVDGNNQEIDNPISAEDFAKSTMTTLISDMVKQYKVHLEQQTSPNILTVN